jgi:exopolyphosphatase / guanosine-5'-triphosphate,3'-diphosphate pyrophosphatase
MPDPIHLAAIDAGSNAIRIAVARAYSALDIEPLYNERYPLRLGESVFVRNRFSEEIFQKAAKAFRHFRALLGEHEVTRFRAVATSAVREAGNRRAFVRHVRRKSGIPLEVISAAEESRLGREAALAALGPEAQPRCILDLGGGSLEISLLRDHTVVQTAQLPAGAVRLMTTLQITGAISAAQTEQIRRYLRALLESRLPAHPNLGEEMVVALGGNAETLAGLAPGPRRHGLPTLEMTLLRERLPRILSLDIAHRVKVYGVRRDRADVMGIAGVIFLTLARYLNLHTLSVPGVGVREGLLQEIARQAFSLKEPHRYTAAARQLLLGARSFARRLEKDLGHAEHVRELSLQLFDQLQPLHHLSAEARVLLEAAALLHDVGYTVSHKGHHKHGEYLTLHGDIPGLAGRERVLVGALVRYHNRKAALANHHPAYSALSNSDKRLVRRLSALLRLAEGLDHSHRQRVVGLRAFFQRGAVALHVSGRGDAAEDLRDAARCAQLFEREFAVRLYFRPVVA